MQLPSGKESLRALGVGFLEPLVLARPAGDVDANEAGPRWNGLHADRIPHNSATGRTSDRITAMRDQAFFNHARITASVINAAVSDLSGTRQSQRAGIVYGEVVTRCSSRIDT